MTDSAIDFLLAFADDEHLMGQQHTEWIGIAPFLEEDLAFSSIGQDELGHAVMLYELVLDLRGVEATDSAIDELAYRRTDAEYRSSEFVEYSTEDWAQALVRHWIYDTVEEYRWSLLGESSLEALRDIAVRADREEVYHRRHANALLGSLLVNGKAQDKLVAALEALTPLVPSLLAPAPGEAAAQAAGVVTGSTADLDVVLIEAIQGRFGVDVALPALAQPAQARLSRSVHFAPLMGRMREVLDLDLEASW